MRNAYNLFPEVLHVKPRVYVSRLGCVVVETEKAVGIAWGDYFMVDTWLPRYSHPEYDYCIFGVSDVVYRFKKFYGLEIDECIATQKNLLAYTGNHLPRKDQS